jgi:hypothetical protein
MHSLYFYTGQYLHFNFNPATSFLNHKINKCFFNFSLCSFRVLTSKYISLFFLLFLRFFLSTLFLSKPFAYNSIQKHLLVRSYFFLGNPAVSKEFVRISAVLHLIEIQIGIKSSWRFWKIFKTSISKLQLIIDRPSKDLFGYIYGSLKPRPISCFFAISELLF